MLKKIIIMLTAIGFFSIAFLSLNAVSPQKQQGEVSGVVYIDVNENLVYDEGIDYLAPNVVLSVVHGNTIKSTGSSDMMGSYSFGNIQNGNFEVRITDVRYQGLEFHQDFEITPHNLVVSNVNIPIKGSTITGFIDTNDQDEYCLVNEYLTISGIYLDENNKYKIDNVPMGDYTLYKCSDLNTAITTINVSSINVLVNDVDMTYDYNLSGMIILDDSLSDISYDLVTINIYDENNDLVTSVTPDSDFYYYVEDLEVGSYTYEVVIDTDIMYYVMDNSFTISEDYNMDINVYANEYFNISGTIYEDLNQNYIVDTADVVLDNIVVDVYDMQRNFIGSYTSDENGLYNIELLKGNYYINLNTNYALSSSNIYFTVKEFYVELNDDMNDIDVSLYIPSNIYIDILINNKDVLYKYFMYSYVEVYKDNALYDTIDLSSPGSDVLGNLGYGVYRFDLYFKHPAYTFLNEDGFKVFSSKDVYITSNNNEYATINVNYETTKEEPVEEDDNTNDVDDTDTTNDDNTNDVDDTDTTNDDNTNDVDDTDTTNEDNTNDDVDNTDTTNDDNTNDDTDNTGTTNEDNSSDDVDNTDTTTNDSTNNDSDNNSIVDVETTSEEINKTSILETGNDTILKILIVFGIIIALVFIKNEFDRRKK